MTNAAGTTFPPFLFAVERFVGELVGERLDFGFSLFDWFGHLTLSQGRAGMRPHELCANAKERQTAGVVLRQGTETPAKFRPCAGATLTISPGSRSSTSTG